MKIEKELMDNLFARKADLLGEARLISEIINNYQEICEHEWAWEDDGFYTCKICSSTKPKPKKIR